MPVRAARSRTAGTHRALLILNQPLKEASMKKNERIDQILTREIVTVHVGQKVSDVRKIFAKEGFHHVPIVSGKKLIGIVSASDILGISVEGVGSDDRSMDAYIDHQFSIEGLMKKDVKTLSPKSTIAAAAELLSDGSFHAVPVVDENDDLAGLITSTDLIRYLRDQF
jgi:CBS domain-containing membrane protein